MQLDNYYEPYEDDIICHHKTGSDDQTYPYHRHNGYEIYIFLSGKIHFYIDTKCYSPNPGDIILIPPSVMHRIVNVETMDYERITINIKSAVLKRLSTKITDLSLCFSNDAKILHFDKPQIDELIVMADKLINSLYKTDYGNDIYTSLNMSMILLKLNEAGREAACFLPDIMPPLVNEIMNYISDHISDDLSLKLLSKKFYHNGAYLSHLFKKHTGLPIRTYIIDNRIEYAKKLLNSGSSVNDAYFESGFNDYSNFIRTFTKVAGISPGKYSKKDYNCN